MSEDKLNFWEALKAGIKNTYEDSPYWEDSEVVDILYTFVKLVFNFLIRAIEILIVIAAVKYAMELHSSWILSVLHWLLLFTIWCLFYIRYNDFIYKHFDLSKKSQKQKIFFRRMNSCISSVFGILLCFLINFVTDEFIRVGFGL